MGDIVAVRQELAPIMKTLEPTLEQLLPPGLPPERLLQTLYVSIANNPTLGQANRNTLLQAATSAAVLALEIDGVTGQGYVVPFKGRAQFLSGYKGMVSLAARTGRTLEGFVVRVGDEFDFDEVTGQVRHRRKLGNESERSVVAAYAISRGAGLPQMARVMSLDQILDVRNASAGWRTKKERSTWGTNFDAMARKTPMRRLSNDLAVIGLHQAAALDTMHDMGRHAWLPAEGGIIVDGKERELSEALREEPPPQPTAGEVLEGEVVESPYTVSFDADTATDARTAERFGALINRSLDKAEQQGNSERIKDMIRLNRGRVEALMGGKNDHLADQLLARFDAYEEGS